MAAPSAPTDIPGARTSVNNDVAPLSTLASAPHLFLQPTSHLYASLLALAKAYLDPLALGVTEAQLQRLKEERLHRAKSRKRKRKPARGDESSDDEEEMLRMKRVHVEGLGVEQVWEQARRVLGAAVGEVERAMPAQDEQEDDIQEEQGKTKSVSFDEDGFEIEESDEDSEGLGEEGLDWTYDGDDIEDSEDDTMHNGMDAENISEGDSEDTSPKSENDTPPSEISEDDGGTFIKDKHGLNDGFFSIDYFNKRSEFLERQDAKGDPDDGAASDEEDIDWEADPMAANSAVRLPSASKRKGDQASDESEDDEYGPTFGNMDLDGAEGESDEDMDMEESNMEGMGDLGNTNNVLYADFFAPPPRKATSKGSKRDQNRGERPRPKEREHLEEVPEAMQEDYMEQTMSRVHRDLFEDDLSDSELEEDDQANDGTLKGGKNLSTHERAQQAIRAQIRELEAENVAAKPWSLKGEAVSAARPLNSLLEEDLDFERAGKPVPVITSEVSESIEALIKRRILALEFDEVIRRRPTDLTPGSGDAPRRGRVEELSDQKATQGLADQYADDIARRADPNAPDARSVALRKKHADIEGLWAKVSAQLDSLSNWHYKPKPAAPALEIRVDAPTIRLEEARPDATDGGGESALAPQEVYRAGDGGKRAPGEVITKGGLAVGQDEMSREQRTRRRRREKERKRKAGADVRSSTNVKAAVSTNGSTRGQKSTKDEVLGQLKKGGVKIIGKTGKLSDVNGERVQSKVAGPSGGGYKL